VKAARSHLYGVALHGVWGFLHRGGKARQHNTVLVIVWRPLQLGLANANLAISQLVVRRLGSLHTVLGNLTHLG
jgi:hypothetical protein